MSERTKIETLAFLWELRNGDGSINNTGNTSITVGRSLVGTDDPAWRYKVSRGLSATNGLTAYQIKAALVSPGAHEFRHPTTEALVLYDVGLRNGITPEIPEPTGSEFDDVFNLGLARFNNRVVSSQRYFEGATFLGEIGEAIRMIKSPAKDLRRLIVKYLERAHPLAKKARKASPKVQRETRKRLAGTYLEAVFGWLPLFNDIEDGMRAVDKLPRYGFFRVGSDALIQTHTSTRSSTTMGSGNTMVFHRNDHIIRSVRFSGAVRFDPLNPRQSLVSRWGLSPVRDFVPTLYQIMPWSWAVDYFSNLGDIVDSWSVGFSNLAWVSATRWRRYQRVIAEDSVSSTNYVTSTLSKTLLYMERKDVLRERPSTLVPALVFQLPDSNTKWANLTAVAQQFR